MSICQTEHENIFTLLGSSAKICYLSSCNSHWLLFIYFTFLPPRDSAVLLYCGCILWNIFCKRYIYILDIWKPTVSTISSILSWPARNQLSSTLNSSNITTRPTFLFSKTIFDKYICLIWDVDLPTASLYHKNMLLVFLQFLLTIVHWFHFSASKRLCSPTLLWMHIMEYML